MVTLNSPQDSSQSGAILPADEGGLRPPDHLRGWRRAWWWFDFLILVKIARLRFVAILVAIGVIITQWDTIIAYYEKWTRPAAAELAGGGLFEWFCPMHPTIVRDNPKDKCPVCFMPLSKRKKGEADQADPLPPGIVNRVQLSPYRVVLAGVGTWRVDYVPLAREIVAAGLVEFNERTQKTVSARVAGRIDELLASETGQHVREGDVLASIYSPDLIVTVQNLLQAERAGNKNLAQDARTRLSLLGIDDEQIDEIVRSGRANTHLKIRSPISGHIIRKYVREGQYVEEGMPLYDVADLSTVWIQAQIYEDDIALLPVEYTQMPDEGDEPLMVTATTRAFPNEEFHGRLRFIYPHVDQATRTLTVRFELDNPDHKLRPGSTATARLRISPQQLRTLDRSLLSDAQLAELDQGRLLAVPESALIDTGSQKIVYRQTEPGVFEGVRVAVGPKMTGPDDVAYVPVLQGLKPGDQVVTSGSFLVDAETRLNPAAGSIYFGGSGSGSGASSMVRATTPEDPEAKIAANLASLPPSDRELAEQQRFCAVLTASPLGSMGPPLKLSLGGQTVFLCCSGCKKQAEANPQKAADRARELRSKAPPKNDQPRLPQAARSGASTKADPEEQTIQDELAKLPPSDRQAAAKQRLCPIAETNRLGSMGPPVKVELLGQSVFLCCEGCEEAAKVDPQGTLARVAQLRAASPAGAGARPSAGDTR
jgi:Cu(I)/Ag(I) efflux system membrane fusion protein